MPESVTARASLRRPLRLTASVLLAVLAIAAAAPASAGSRPVETAATPSLALKEPARSPDMVLATVDGVPITQGRLTAADEDIGALLTLQGPQRDAYLLGYVIDTMLIARSAERNGFDRAAGFDRRLEYEKTKVLYAGVLSKITAEATSDAAMHAAAEKAEGDLILALRKAATIERFSPAAKN